MVEDLFHKKTEKEANMVGSPLEVAFRDLEFVLDELKEAQSHYERKQREDLVASQLTEARKSTETAISVARLTKLAFIFIPLNFVTSFYGMNMKPFGGGNVSLWIFFATALAPIIGTCLLFPSHFPLKS
jgi:Mg2+ and Co2+ transporter CorA